MSWYTYYLKYLIYSRSVLQNLGRAGNQIRKTGENVTVFPFPFTTARSPSKNSFSIVKKLMEPGKNRQIRNWIHTSRPIYYSVYCDTI